MWTQRCHYGNVRNSFQTPINLSCYHPYFQFHRRQEAYSMRECCVHSSPCHLPRRDPRWSLRVSSFSFYSIIFSSLQWVCGDCGEGGAFLLLQRETEALSWELFWKKNKFLTNTFWKLLYGQIRTDQKMVSFLKNEAGLRVWPLGTLPAAAEPLSLAMCWLHLLWGLLRPNVIGVRKESLAVL